MERIDSGRILPGSGVAGTVLAVPRSSQAPCRQRRDSEGVVPPDAGRLGRVGQGQGRVERQSRPNRRPPAEAGADPHRGRICVFRLGSRRRRAVPAGRPPPRGKDRQHLSALPGREYAGARRQSGRRAAPIAMRQHGRGVRAGGLRVHVQRNVPQPAQALFSHTRHPADRQNALAGDDLPPDQLHRLSSEHAT